MKTVLCTQIWDYNLVALHHGIDRDLCLHHCCVAQYVLHESCNTILKLMKYLRKALTHMVVTVSLWLNQIAL